MKIRNKVAGGAVSAIVAALCLSAPVEAAAANLEGRWKQHSAAALRSHKKETQVYRIIEGKKYVYFIVRGAPFSRDDSYTQPYAATHKLEPLSIFRYDKTEDWNDFNIKSLALEEELSGVYPVALEYSVRNNVLAIIYDNSKMDFVFDNGHIVTSTALRDLAVPAYGLRFNNITFDEAEKKAYVAGSFGYAVISMETGELIEGVQTDKEVTWAAPVGNHIVLFAGKITDARWVSPPDIWEKGEVLTETYIYPLGRVPEKLESPIAGGANLEVLMPLSENSFAALSPGSSDTVATLVLCKINDEGKGSISNLAEELVFDSFVDWRNRKIFRYDAYCQESEDGFFVHSLNNIYKIIQGEGTPELITISKENGLTGNEKASKSATIDGENLWLYTYDTPGISDANVVKKGFYKRNKSGEQWVGKSEVASPNAPVSSLFVFADWNPKYGMLFRGPGSMFNNVENSVDNLTSYKNGEWTDLSYSANNTKYVNPIKRAKEVKSDPVNPEWIWGVANMGGLFRMDISDYTNFLQLGSKNYNSYKTSYPGYFPIFDPQKDWTSIINFSNVDFDNDGTMWFVRQRMSSYSEDGSVEYDYYADVIKNAYTPIYYLTAEERERIGNIGADQSQLPDILDRAIKVPRAAVHEMCTINALKSEKNKNILAINSGAYVNEYQFSFFVDHKGTPCDTSDDRYALCDELYDTNGERIYYKFERDIYEDPLTGDVWLLTASGPLLIDPQSFLAGDKTVRKVKIEKGNGMINDGATFEFITVNKVCHDYMGRKWLATETGLYCLSPDTKEMLGYYTIDNSPLPSNDVFNVVYNPETLSLFVMTEKGLAEFIPSDSNAPLASGNHLSVWPSAVSPHYMGYVNISGADNSAEYEVNDKEGKVIVTLGKPEGGLLQWNLKDAAGSHVGAGRYNIRRSGSDEIQPVIVY